jgi:hypothetical protein
MRVKDNPMDLTPEQIANAPADWNINYAIAEHQEEQLPSKLIPKQPLCHPARKRVCPMASEVGGFVMPKWARIAPTP